MFSKGFLTQLNYYFFKVNFIYTKNKTPEESVSALQIHIRPAGSVSALEADMGIVK